MTDHEYIVVYIILIGAFGFVPLGLSINIALDKGRHWFLGLCCGLFGWFGVLVMLTAERYNK